MSGAVQLPWCTRFFRWIARPPLRFLYRTLARIEIYKEENNPSDGSNSVTPNHISIYEPPLLAAFWPSELVIVAAVEVHDRPFQSEIKRLHETAPVHRAMPDRPLIRTGLERLAEGLPVLIFPEGERTRPPQLDRKKHRGTAYLAAKSCVAMLPVGIEGPYQLWQCMRQLKRPSGWMRSDQPLNFPALDLRSSGRKEEVRKRTEEIMQAIAQLLPIVHQSVYALHRMRLLHV